jgi:hypothetical protein
MDDPAECEHDFRRFEYKDINPQAEHNRLLWVICWRCGRTPVGLTEMGHRYNFAVNGNWPEDVRVTNWEVDDYGPYVECEKVEASGRDD